MQVKLVVTRVQLVHRELREDWRELLWGFLLILGSAVFLRGILLSEEALREDRCVFVCRRRGHFIGKIIRGVMLIIECLELANLHFLSAQRVSTRWRWGTRVALILVDRATWMSLSRHDFRKRIIACVVGTEHVKCHLLFSGIFRRAFIVTREQVGRKQFGLDGWITIVARVQQEKCILAYFGQKTWSFRCVMTSENISLISNLLVWQISGQCIWCALWTLNSLLTVSNELSSLLRRYWRWVAAR